MPLITSCLLGRDSVGDVDLELGGLAFAVHDPLSEELLTDRPGIDAMSGSKAGPCVQKRPARMLGGSQDLITCGDNDAYRKNWPAPIGWSGFSLSA